MLTVFFSFTRCIFCFSCFVLCCIFYRKQILFFYRIEYPVVNNAFAIPAQHFKIIFYNKNLSVMEPVNIL